MQTVTPASRLGVLPSPCLYRRPAPARRCTVVPAAAGAAAGSRNSSPSPSKAAQKASSAPAAVQPSTEGPAKKRVLVVGGGWAGEPIVPPWSRMQVCSSCSRIAAFTAKSAMGGVALADLCFTSCCVVPAGFGALKHLAEQGYDVTLLDASPNPGGLSGGPPTSCSQEQAARPPVTVKPSRLLPHLQLAGAQAKGARWRPGPRAFGTSVR